MEHHGRDREEIKLLTPSGSGPWIWSRPGPFFRIDPAPSVGLAIAQRIGQVVHVNASHQKCQRFPEQLVVTGRNGNDERGRPAGRLDSDSRPDPPRQPSPQLAQESIPACRHVVPAVADDLFHTGGRVPASRGFWLVVLRGRSQEASRRPRPGAARARGRSVGRTCAARWA